MKSLEYNAYYDVIALLTSARRSVQPISVIEVHLFAYLACVISLSDGRPINSWGYSFSLTDEGFPYSTAIGGAIDALEVSSMLSVGGNGQITLFEELIKAERKALDTLSELAARTPSLIAAIDCALLIPVGAIRYAMSMSPGIHTALRRNQISMLLSDDDIEEISDEYRLIDSAMDGNHADLMDPAIVWLSARLSQEQKAAQVA